jgi:transcriptional regulator with XRE-family HTH domain
VGKPDTVLTMVKRKGDGEGRSSRRRIKPKPTRRLDPNVDLLEYPVPDLVAGLLAMKGAGSQKRLAVLAEVSEQTVSDWLAGVSSPSAETLSLLCRQEGIALSKFFRAGEAWLEKFRRRQDEETRKALSDSPTAEPWVHAMRKQLTPDQLREAARMLLDGIADPEQDEPEQDP